MEGEYSPVATRGELGGEHSPIVPQQGTAVGGTAVGGTALSPLRGSETHTTGKSMGLASPPCPHTEEKPGTTLRGAVGVPQPRGAITAFTSGPIPAAP